MGEPARPQRAAPSTDTPICDLAELSWNRVARNLSPDQWNRRLMCPGLIQSHDDELVSHLSMD